ncbi:MAG: hypothetical protein HIU90_05795 [Proteobacteria bacterium]|nr:hypothetical protein [Pseudomonadota bacterium]
MIIHLNGWPGVGKKTVGAVLSHHFGARFIDNHCLHDPALACAGYGDPARFPLYEIVRDACYAVLQAKPRSEVFVMTNALTVNADRELEAWQAVVTLAIARQVPLVPIILTAERDELLRRVALPHRGPRKLTDPADLAQYLETTQIQVPDVVETLCLDVTALVPSEAADIIVQHISDLGHAVAPAGMRHMIFR